MEVARERLGSLGELYRIVRRHPQRFILFLDDLTFEADDADYRAFKSLLEGALELFRRQNPDVPITHFVCPAYYTRPGATPTDVTFFLREHIAKRDEVGVHLHAWNSLVEEARVPVRTGRSFLTDLLRLVLAPAAANEVGPALASMLIYILMAAVLIVSPRGLLPAKGGTR